MGFKFFQKEILLSVIWKNESRKGKWKKKEEAKSVQQIGIVYLEKLDNLGQHTWNPLQGIIDLLDELP